MKPKPKKVTREITQTITSWSCGPMCCTNHQTPEMAEKWRYKCEAKTRINSPDFISPGKLALQRRIEALRLRKEGLTFKEIGEQVGVSAGRAHQMVRTEERRIEWRKRREASNENLPTNLG